MSLYIAAYDISDDYRRDRVARVLLRFGHRLQRSVYEVWLEMDERKILCREVGPLLDREDTFELFPLDERGSRGRITWQRAAKSFDPVILG